MNLVNLIEKVIELSKQEIDELVEKGIILDDVDIETILLHEDEALKETLFKNEKLKQFILKEINSYCIKVFATIAKDPNKEIPEMYVKICKNYLKTYFKEGLALEIMNEKGKNLFNIIVRAKKNQVVSEEYKSNKVWSRYRSVINEMIKKDVLKLSSKEIDAYDETLKYHFGNVVLGYDIPEAEFMLKIAQKKEIDITKLTALDRLAKQYEKEKNNANSKMIKEDEVFSLILDYSILLKQNGIEKEGEYSPIKEMEKSIREGKFGENDSLSKEEFAFVLKFLNNSDIFEVEVKEKINGILTNQNLQINMGVREVQELLLNTETTEQLIEKFPNLKNEVVKQFNLFAIQIFQNISDSKECSEDTKKIVETYLKTYFKEGLALEILNENGRTLFEAISKSKRSNEFVKEQYEKNKIWPQYSNIIKMLLEKDPLTLSDKEVEQYNETLKQYIGKIIIGYNLNEVDYLLKLAGRDDVNISKLTSLDVFVKRYEKQKNASNKEMVRDDEVFSAALDYDILLKQKGIEKEGQYSPIKEMERLIREGKFGENNSLSKEQFAFVLKILQNPEVIDNDIKEKLNEMLEKGDIELSIGNREMNKILADEKYFDTICTQFPNLEQKILKQIDSDIYLMLNNLETKKREINLEEREKFAKYIEKYYEKSLNVNYSTIEMSKLICLIIDFANPKMLYNIKSLDILKETTQFVGQIYSENKIFSKYVEAMKKMAKEIEQDKSITSEVFEKYDEIFYEISYRVNENGKSNLEIIRILEEKSKELNIRSKTLENNIEMYINKCIKNNEISRTEEFNKTIKSYYIEQIQKDAIEINENSAISHLIRAAQKGKIPEEIATFVLEELEKSQKHKINKKDDIQTSDMKEYVKNAAEIKLRQGRVPEECCKFIIKNALLQNEDLLKYKGMIERALEDVAEYGLEESQINDYFVGVLNQKFLTGEKINGVQNDRYKTIILSEETLNTEGIFKLLETVLHEITHAEQDKQIKELEVNRDTYKMLKEQILRNQDNKFYNINYKYMYNEIDARKNGYVRRLQMLRKLGLTDEQIMELNAGNLKETINNYLQEYEQGKTKKIDTEQKSVDTIFLETLKENPELIEEYPILNIEYEKTEDGVKKKSLAGILKAYEEKLGMVQNQREKARLSGIVSDIVLNGSEIPEDKMQDELEELMTLESENPIIIAFMNKIKEKKFPKEIMMRATMKKMYENTNAVDRQDMQKDLKKDIQPNRESIKQKEKPNGERID